MLTKPKDGWSDFSLEGTSVYGVSYLNDIAFEWLEQAIRGLSTMRPFCVEAYLEPGRMICVVSHYNCHIIVENEDDTPIKQEDFINEYSRTSMIEFCRFLYDDVNADMEGWVTFVDYDRKNPKEKTRLLIRQLEILKELIVKQAKKNS